MQSKIIMAVPCRNRTFACSKLLCSHNSAWQTPIWLLLKVSGDIRLVHVSEMATPAQESSYRLSAELTGHSGDVRAVTGFRLEDCDADYVVTTSRDKTARVWVREGREFKTVKIIGQHTGYVSAVCVIPADSDAGRSQREKTVRYALQITKLHFFHILQLWLWLLVRTQTFWYIPLTRKRKVAKI